MKAEREEGADTPLNTVDLCTIHKHVMLRNTHNKQVWEHSSWLQWDLWPARPSICSLWLFGFSINGRLSRLLLWFHRPTGKILQSQCSSTYLSIDTPTSHSTYCNLTKLMKFISHPCRLENKGETFVLSMHRENCITNDTKIYTLDWIKGGELALVQSWRGGTSCIKYGRCCVLCVVP